MRNHALLSADQSDRRHARELRVRLFAGTVWLAGLVFLGGCNKGPAPAPPAAAPDTSQAAPAAPTPATPALPPPSEAAPATSAAAPPPGPAAPAPAGPAMTAAPGAAMTAAPPPPLVVPRSASIVVRMGETVSAKDNSVGDTFTGTLAQSVLVKGVSVFRAGTPVTGTVTASKGQGKFKGDGALGITIRKVGNYTVATSNYEKSVSGKGKRTAGFIGGGGGAGALIGGLAGGGKGALIGGLLGAGGGTAAGAFTGNKNVSIPAETVVTFTLEEPLTVRR
jgi:hypothetical protein